MTSPPRGIISAEPVPAADGGGMLIGCDCGTTTQVVIDWDRTQPVPHREVAFTCDGCGSVHWFSIGPPAPDPVRVADDLFERAFGRGERPGGTS